MACMFVLCVLIVEQRVALLNSSQFLVEHAIGAKKNTIGANNRHVQVFWHLNPLINNFQIRKNMWKSDSMQITVLVIACSLLHY